MFLFSLIASCEGFCFFLSSLHLKFGDVGHLRLRMDIIKILRILH